MKLRRRMRLRINAGELLVALALCLSIGLHWACVRAFARTGMLVRYSQSEGVLEALRMTIDGNNP